MREIQALDDELVVAAMEDQLADFADLAVDEGVVIARERLALQRRTAFEFCGSFVELHADIGSNHRAKNGDVSLLVQPAKNEDQHFGLATRNKCAAERENDSADNKSSHKS